VKLPILLIGLLTYSAHSQQIKVNDYQVDVNGTVNIDFTIEQSHSSREVYDVLFYSSIDEFTLPIEFKVENLKPGTRKKVSFSGSEQFGGYGGSFQLKLVAQASTYPIQVMPLDKGLKIGKSNTISWTDYHESGPYDVSLYQGGQLKSKLATGLIGTRFNGLIPKSLEKGDYSVLITPSNEKYISERFPVLLKKGINPLIVVGVAVLGGGGVFLAANGGDSGSSDEELPDPPGPPSGN